MPLKCMHWLATLYYINLAVPMQLILCLQSHEAEVLQ